MRNRTIPRHRTLCLILSTDWTCQCQNTNETLGEYFPRCKPLSAVSDTYLVIYIYCQISLPNTPRILCKKCLVGRERDAPLVLFPSIYLSINLPTIPFTPLLSYLNRG